MYLESIHLQGFKSFALKTVLKFLPPTEKSRGITAIVGPNGSGKSNVVDAMRWVLGEQSIKTLRGKKTEDVIFAGSDKRQRSGFAEVTLVLRNEKVQPPHSPPIPTKVGTGGVSARGGSAFGGRGNRENEDDILSYYLDAENIEITRRVYRDGASDYYLGKNKVRLIDIQMLLAKLGMSNRAYGIIGQGMIDSILIMNDAEKKEFFDEATGIKQYQIKRNHSLLQLKNATINLREAQTIINEIEPHLKYLRRQVHRLEEKTRIEEELHSLQHIYYSSLFHDLEKKIVALKDKIKEANKELESKKTELKNIDKKLALTQYLDIQSPVIGLQEKYQKLLDEKSKLTEKELRTKNKLWQLSQKIQKAQMPSINPADLLERVEKIEKLEEEIAELLQNKTADLKLAVEKITVALEETRNLTSFLKKHRILPESHEEEEKELEQLKKQTKELETKINETKRQIEAAYKKEEESKRDFINLQKNLQAQGEEIHALENQLNDLKIELARLETRKETLEKEMFEELKEGVEKIKNEPLAATEPLDALYQKIQKAKYQIALAGGVDEQVIQEYKESNERYTFLKNQTDDLSKSIGNLKSVIEELDEIMESQFNKSFNKINESFGKYFGLLFGGGHANLSKKEIQILPDGRQVEPRPCRDEADEDNLKEQVEKMKKLEIFEIVSTPKHTIEINAAPPGKKIKGLQMLSGGERALTAIALVCGIISTNPSPCIILDEVDAALDETNSIKFAEIIKELAKQSQFIVITHNRATMENSSLLYGTTMGDDNSSKILSVDLREAEKLAE